MSTDVTQRAMDRIADLSGQPLDLVTLWRESSDVIANAVPYAHHGACWYTLDPASLLITSHFNDAMIEFPREWLAHEYYGDDVNKLADVARSETGISTLHEATDGDPSQSRRWQENVKLGGDQEMIARLQTRDGAVWGALGLYRGPGEPMFSPTEKRFVSTISQHLALGARRALLMAEAAEPDGPNAPGSSYSPTAGRSSRPLRVSSAGSPSSPTVTGTREGSRRRSSRWPEGPCGPRSSPTPPGRLPSPGCSPAAAPGSSCTERR